MHALVTGAGGFLGQYIVEQLVARGDRVRSLSRRPYEALARLGVEQVTGDIQDMAAVAAACRGVDCVFHVAAVAGIWGPWRYYYGINTVGTRNVIEGCLHERVGKLVFTSSPSVTFAARDQAGIDESAPYPERWLCYYPQTKAMAEQLVLVAKHQGSCHLLAPPAPDLGPARPASDSATTWTGRGAANCGRWGTGKT